MKPIKNGLSIERTLPITENIAGSDVSVSLNSITAATKMNAAIHIDNCLCFW